MLAAIVVVVSHHRSGCGLIGDVCLTARTEEVDKVVGLELGADDYITKPFSMKELLARVRARLRRREEAPGEQVLSAGSIRVDLLRREATRQGEPLSLKPKEFDLLVCLMRNKGRLLTRGQLLESVWHYEGFDQTPTMDVHIGRLREKIEERPSNPAWIITVRGSGYRFAGVATTPRPIEPAETNRFL